LSNSSASVSDDSDSNILLRTADNELPDRNVQDEILGAPDLRNQIIAEVTEDSDLSVKLTEISETR